MRQEFEKLPEIEKALRLGVVWNGEYYEEDKNFVYQTAEWANGALYAYQEQQKKLDAVLDFIDSEDLGHDARLGDFYRDLKELLK